MLLPFVKWIWVRCGLEANRGGRLWVKEAILDMIRLVCRQEGPTMPIALLGWLTAYKRSIAQIMWVFPLWRHHRAAVNWLLRNSWANSFWYGYGWKPKTRSKKAEGALLNPKVSCWVACIKWLLFCWRLCHRGRIWLGRNALGSFCFFLEQLRILFLHFS